MRAERTQSSRPGLCGSGLGASDPLSSIAKDPLRGLLSQRKLWRGNQSQTVDAPHQIFQRAKLGSGARSLSSQTSPQWPHLSEFGLRPGVVSPDS